MIARLGTALGVVLGGVVGAVAGARVESWTGGLVGAYAGVLCGMCVVGGLVGVIARDLDRASRAEAVVMLAFGLVGAVGAVTGYWLVSTHDIPRFTPLAGFFVGLVLPGALAGLAVLGVLGADRQPEILVLLTASATGAGAGAWLGTLFGAPVLVAIGLVVGGALGAAVAHAFNVAVHEAFPTSRDIVNRHHGDHYPW
ncbi:hypothetical protein AB0H12_29475 [Actinosynnema sp. NPDC023794]